MLDASSISPDPPQDHGLDYAWLRAEGIRLLQQLSGEIWTDYNEHDPGVTTLEQLCYALTELSYRAAFPVADLLADERGAIDTTRQALFPPRDIFPCNALTTNDYRRLVLDRVPAVGNVWLSPVKGLYEITLHVPGADPCSCDEAINVDSVREQVQRVYARHRNLGEDIRAVRVLAPIATLVRAVITIDDTRAPEAVLAELLFNVGRFLAPEPRREPLDARIAAGAAPETIFEGPLLRNGFIRDEDLTPRRDRIQITDVTRILARTDGVTSVRDVSLRAGDAGKAASGGETVPVPESGILVVDTRPMSVGEYSIRLLRRGVKCSIDATRFKRELARLWADQRRTYPLAPRYDTSFAVPRGERRDLARYTSIQGQFPLVYGIGAYGPPEDATPLRRAQARQLKGYLLVFEQLLADFFAQLSHARDLFSTDPSLTQTYFHQSAADSVPDAGDLVSEHHAADLTRALQSVDPAIDRRSRFLDVLLALYADGLAPSSIPAVADDGTGGEALLRAKIARLEHLVLDTRARGRGFDYTAPSSTHNIAGMEVRCRVELGLDALAHKPLLDTLEATGLELVDDEARASVGRTLTGKSGIVDTTFELVTTLLQDHGRPGDSGRSTTSTPLLRSHTVTEGFLHAATSLSSFRAGALPGESEISLVCTAPGDKHPRLLGKYPDLVTAVDVAVALVELTRTLRHRCRQLYLVEHTLLRFGRLLRGKDHPVSPDPAPFVPGFTVTAVLSHSPGPEGGAAFEELAREVVRRNAPAHLAVEICFLTPAQMGRFEALHRTWQDALRQRSLRPLIHASVRLRRFLEHRKAITG